jgi:hypothetical protein
MTDISLIQYARLLGANTVIGMAQKVGLTPPPPPISVRNLINLAGQIILPFAPVDLQPQNGAQGISNNPFLFFRDSGPGTPAAAGQFAFIVTQNNVVVDPSHQLTGPAVTASPLTPPGVKWAFPLPAGLVTLTVWGQNRAGDGPASSSTFTVVSPAPPPPPPQPTITASIGSDDKVTVNGQGFNKSLIVNLQATVRGGISTPLLANGEVDVRNQWPQTTADTNGSFNALIILPQNFMPNSIQFHDGITCHVHAGETIAVIAKNANVSNFTPGPGVSNVVTMTAPATV